MHSLFLLAVESGVAGISPDHIAAEAADVVYVRVSRRPPHSHTLALRLARYFALTRCVAGGVAISDSSRTPERASCNVRGIGVAVSVST